MTKQIEDELISRIENELINLIKGNPLTDVGYMFFMIIAGAGLLAALIPANSHLIAIVYGIAMGLSFVAIAYDSMNGRFSK